MLNADLSELIYGVNPGEYPGFQKRHMAATVVFGVVLLIYLFFRIFFQRLVLACCNSYHLSYPRMLVLYGFPILALFFGGMLMPSLLALYSSVKLSDKTEKWILILSAVLGAASALLLVSVLIGFYGGPFFPVWQLCFSDAGRALAVYICPFASGLFVKLRLISKAET